MNDTRIDATAYPEWRDAADEQRRNFLVRATLIIGGIGVTAAAVPFVQSWWPDAKARSIGAPIKVDVGKLEPGAMLGPIPAWRGKPIFIAYRTEQAMKILNMTKHERRLTDPASRVGSQQPQYAANYYRALAQNPEIGVFIGICTHLGCVPRYFPEIGPAPFDEEWEGGFYCPCHGSRFDLAGRVYKNVPAPTNLVVPPYRYESEKVIVIGESKESG